MFAKNRQYKKFCLYGFLKNLRFYDAFLLLFLLENDISFSQIGILYGAREIISFVFEVPSGIIADSYGRKNALLFAFLLYIFSYVVFYLSANFTFLLLAMLLIGIGDAFRSGTHKGMIMDYLRLNHWEEHKIEYYGLTRSWSQIGSALSALFGGFIVFYSGSFRFIYLLSIFPYLINFINIISYPTILNHSSKTINRKSTTIRTIIENTISTVKKKRVLLIINSSALHSAFLKAIKDYIQPIIASLAIIIPAMSNINAKSKSGLIIGITYFFIFLLSSFASKISGNVSKFGVRDINKKTLLFGLMAGILCGVLYQFQFWTLSILFFVAIYFIENLRKPMLTGFLSNQVPNEILASVISTQSLYKTLITAALSLLLGIFSDYFGIGIALLVISLLLLVITIFLKSEKMSIKA